MPINSPRDISGLVAWYSAQAETGYASGAQMTQWTDLSGNGNHATAVSLGGSAPLWESTTGPSGGPAVHFTNGYFNLPTGLLSTAGEVMTMARGDINASSVDQGWWRFGNSGSANHYTYLDTVYDDFGSNTRRSYTPTVAVTGWRRLTVWSAANDWATQLDGTAQASAATNTVQWAATQRIGQSNAGTPSTGATAFKGWHSCFVLYNRKLTSTERADLVSWMQANPSGGTAPAAAVNTITPTLAGTSTLSVASVNTVAALRPSLAGTSTFVAQVNTVIPLRPSLPATGALTVVTSGTGSPVLLSTSLTASSALTVAAVVPVNAPIAATVNGSGTLAVPRYIAREHQTATGVAVSGAGELEATHRAQPAAQRKYRWKFNDPSTSERWSMPINPDSMTSPHIPRTFKYAQGIERGIDRLRVFETPQMPHVWEFGGRIRTKSHHDDLAYWARKEHEIEVTDHLDRTFEVIIQEFRPEDRHPQKWHPPDASLSDPRRWRMKYTMRVLLLRRVS